MIMFADSTEEIPEDHSSCIDFDCGKCGGLNKLDDDSIFNLLEKTEKGEKAVVSCGHCKANNDLTPAMKELLGQSL